MNNIIECENLSHFYGERCIYSNLSFSVPKGTVLGLLGKNGTGKTTTINILSGFLKPHSGSCKMFGQSVTQLNPALRQQIGLLIEGHVQYSFMNIQQIERFYSRFYPKWNSDPYYELIRKLRIAPKQKIARMSCGQRSQVALGLILAQDPELLILDDFSMGLDPGYRRLFVDYLKEYAKAGNKTVFVTSHIIQDMERLIDDCIILDYGRILLQDSLSNFVGNFKKYVFAHQQGVVMPDIAGFYHPEVLCDHVEAYSFEPVDRVKFLVEQGRIPLSLIAVEDLNLEDAFIGLTGKY